MMALHQRSTIVFSSLGHLYVHLFTAFYFVIVLALEDAWALPYHELVGIWTIGALMVGVAALPAGALSDKIGAIPMMIVYFVGMGLSAVAAGLSTGPTTLFVSLSFLGVFASIYHPVGIPWLVRNAGSKTGKVLGFNGIFGSLGTAVAALVAGFLIALFGWRWAFIVPGVVSVVTGAALVVSSRRGNVPDHRTPTTEKDGAGRQEMIRGFVILLATMFLGGMIYHSTQTSLPKVFEMRGGALFGEGTLGVGLTVAMVYFAASFMQMIGGYLADRFSLKWVYVGSIAIQAPMLWWASSVSGITLMLVAVVMVMGAAGALPAENMLLARYTPQHRHGLAFGVKFLLSFGAGPLSVQLVAQINEQTGDFYWVFFLLAMFACASVLIGTMLPSLKKRGPVNAVPGTAA